MRLPPRVSIICLKLRASARPRIGDLRARGGSPARRVSSPHARYSLSGPQNDPRSSLSACLSRGPSRGPRDLRHVRLLRQPTSRGTTDATSRMARTPGQSGAGGNDFSRVQEDKAARCANPVTRAAQSGVAAATRPGAVARRRFADEPPPASSSCTTTSVRTSSRSSPRHSAQGLLSRTGPRERLAMPSEESPRHPSLFTLEETSTP